LTSPDMRVKYRDQLPGAIKAVASGWTPCTGFFYSQDRMSTV